MTLGSRYDGGASLLKFILPIPTYCLPTPFPSLPYGSKVKGAFGIPGDAY